MWSLSNYLITLKRKEDILIGVSDLTEYRPDTKRGAAMLKLLYHKIKVLIKLI